MQVIQFLFAMSLGAGVALGYVVAVVLLGGKEK